MANLLGTTVNGALFASGRISVTYDTDRYQFNFLRASGSNWWVTNDSTALGLHVDNVGDRFYFSTAGDFYSDTNGWLSTALAGKSNVGHTHDDRYYTETESDGRFQPLENQRLSTGNSPTFANVYATEWFRNYGNQGIYNQTYGTHFYSNTAEGFVVTGSGGVVQLQFRSNHQSTIRGYVYADTSNNIGFLNDGGSWALRMSSTRNAEIFGSDLTIGVGGANSTNIIMGDNDEGGRTIHCNSNRIGFLTQAGSWGAWLYDSADWEAGSSVRAPIFYDSEDTAYYVDPNSTSRLLNVQTIGYVGFNGNQTRDKLRVWDSGTYAIGMKSGYNYGHLGTDQYAMSFQMNSENGRGFWWGDDAHSDNQGAASLTTDGRMVIAKSLSIGEGEAVVSPSSTPLYVKGTTSGADVVGVDGINGRLFTVTDDLSGSLFSVNTIAGLPVIEAFADNTVTIGKYGYATTWSTTGFMTVPNSANIYRDLFINGGRSGDFGNRLIIGTDAATYTLNDSNQRPVAYLHGQYPVLTLNHTVTGNTDHGPTIQFTHHTNDKQWVIGSNGTGTRLDIGYSTNTDRNPHNGIGDHNGSTFIRVDNSGNVQLGRGAGRSTWVNDILYVGASDSGDSHMYFGEDSSNWYGLHWYWDSGYTVYLYGRNAGTDTEIMRYTTNSNTYVEWRRHFHMNNYQINHVNQLHFNAGTRFVGNDTHYLNFKADAVDYGSIHVRDGNDTLRGYLGYFDSTGFGLLNSSGSWGIRLTPGNAEAELYYAGGLKLRTLSGGVRIYGDLFLDDNYGYGIVGIYNSYRYQGIFAMGNAYKLAADGQGTGDLYGLAWTHTNVGGQSKAGLEHQLLVMNYGTTQTAIGVGIWTAGTITTVNHGNSSQWNTAYGWGNHASADYIVKGTQVLSAAGWTTATRFGSVGDISQDAGNHALSVRSEQNNDAFMSFHIGSDYAVHFGLDRVSNRMHVGGWSDGTGNKYQIWDSRDFSSTNISNWNTAYGWGNHASAGYQAASTAITTSNIGSQSVNYASSAGNADTVDNLHASDFVRAYTTTADNIDADWGQSFKTFDPVPSGTPPLASPNIRTINIGENFARRTQLAFDYASDLAYFRRRNDSGWQTWREFIHSGNIASQSVSYATTAGALTSMNISQFTNNSGYITGYTETDTLATVTSRGATTSGDITINGGILNTDLARIINPHGASYVVAPSSITGAWKIKLPAGSRLLYPMLQFTINIYTYSTGVVSQIRVGGHFSGASWYNIFAYGITDTAPQYTIRFGFDATDAMCVWVGELGTAWSYPSVFVTDFQNGYSAVQSSWASGWTITNVTAFDTVTNARSVALGLNTNNYNSYAPTLTGTGASGTWGIGISGNAATSSTFSTSWTNYKGVTDNAVAGQLMWKNYGNSHTIFDASNSTSPTGSAVNNTNSAIAWAATYPTLMGWNGDSTYGVRVDSARLADTAGALTSMNISQFTNNSGYITGYTETDTLNSVTTRGASTTNDITVGGLTVGGSLSYGTYTAVSNYVTGADNILLKGNASGVSGIFFESEKNGTNINHPSDFGFIQYHAYGIGGSSGEANRLVIGVSNDADDIIVLNPVNTNGLVVRVGAGTTEYTVYHSGNIPTWNQNTTGNAATATIASTVTVNSGNTSAAWYPIVWHSGNTVYSSSGVEIYAAGNYIKCQYINTTDNDESGITRFVIKNGDSYHRSATTTVAADIIRGVASGSWGINITGSSATATTANRLERYGVIYGNNWNDYYLNNRFIVASAHNATGTNKPDPAYNYGSMMSYYNSGEDHYQIYVTENSVNSNGKDRKMYYRSGWNGSWGGWRSVVDVYNSVCYIDAAVTATGDITAFSDGRVKENVETLEGALDKTLKLRGVSYNRTDIEDKSTKIGVIAQEILEVVPEVVSQDENGMYAVSYGNITALLIEAIKEQQKQIDELKEIINGLTK